MTRIALTLALLMACVTPASDSQRVPTERIDLDTGTTIRVFTDRSRNVTCYVVDTNTRGPAGISCIQEVW